MAQELHLFINRAGHYVGEAEVLEVIVTGLRNIQHGDLLMLSNASVYSETDVLARGTTIHKHTIPKNLLSNLAVGDYIVTASLNDGQQSGNANYRVAPIPIASFTSLSPNELQIPLNAPLSITGQWHIQGEQMNSISGSSELIGLSASINQLN
ncbi:MAG: hypothetical protein FWD82_04940 [Defluviitaleaceae bacterium]|nr:hypothetical protein [Defluviitaleaceae bacterium]